MVGAGGNVCDLILQLFPVPDGVVRCGKGLAGMCDFEVGATSTLILTLV